MQTELFRVFGVLATFLLVNGSAVAATQAVPPFLVGYLQKQGSQKPVSPATQLQELAESYFEDFLVLNPAQATFIGDHRYDAVLRNDLTREAREETATFYRAYLRELRRLPKRQLDSSDQLTWDVLENDCSTSLERLHYPHHLLPVGNMFDGPTLFALLGSGQSVQPFKTFAQYTNFLGRIRCFTPWIDTAIANMREGMRRKIVLPKVIAIKSASQLDQMLSAPPLQGVFGKPLQSLPSDLTPGEKQYLEREYAAALENQVYPAYRRLATFLRQEYLPACRDTLGFSSLPDGKRWYAFLARDYTTSSLSPEEIHKLGEREVARIEAQMEAIKREVGFDGPLKDLSKFLETRAPGQRTREELLAGYEAIRKRVLPALPSLFGTLPKAGFEIRTVEPFREKTSASQYTGASMDGTRPGIFYVNAAELAKGPMIPSESLFLHEAAPGHYFQGTVAMEQARLPRFRRFSDDAAYSEGWALYAESLGPELGCYKDPYQRLDALSSEMLRARRLVMDTGLHAKGWSRAQTIEYFLKTPGASEMDANLEVDRYIAWPGQALSYKIGQLQILAMRAKAGKALGAGFDIRGFHDQLLKEGAAPLNVLEKQIDRWIRSRKAGSGSAS